jgi:hypothetical protein
MRRDIAACRSTCSRKRLLLCDKDEDETETEAPLSDIDDRGHFTPPYRENTYADDPEFEPKHPRREGARPGAFGLSCPMEQAGP